MTEVHHVVDGPADAPPLVLSSSLGAGTAMWDPQVGPLGRHLRLIRYDHRGHGRSPVPPGPYAIEDLGRDVLELLDRLGVARASFCGISLGGMVGMWLAGHAPERIHRLVLVSTSAHVPPPEMWQERADAVRAAGTTAVVADAVAARWLTPGYAQRHPETAARLRATVAATPPEGYAACCGAIGRMDLRGSLGAVRAPTLVIAGAEDPSIPPDHGRSVAAAIADARFELVAPAAHLCSVEQAPAVNELILEHVRS